LLCSRVSQEEKEMGYRVSLRERARKSRSLDQCSTIEVCPALVLGVSQKNLGEEMCGWERERGRGKWKAPPRDELGGTYFGTRHATVLFCVREGGIENGSNLTSHFALHPFRAGSGSCIWILIG
jgi:hypothetical protein